MVTKICRICTNDTGSINIILKNFFIIFHMTFTKTYKGSTCINDVHSERLKLFNEFEYRVFLTLGKKMFWSDVKI